MTWIKIDDQMFMHPKVRSVGPLGLALQIAALSYANSLRTDGELPKNLARTLLELPRPKAVIDKLVEAGIWEDKGEHYQIHDYLDYQASRAQIETAREASRQAGKRGAAKRWQGVKMDGVPHRVTPSTTDSKTKTKTKKDISTDVDISAPSSSTTEIVTLRKEKPRDEIWDTLMYVCRINTSGIPASARSGYGKVVKELKALGATADDVHQRGAAYRIAYRDAPLTPHALLKHWAQVEGVATQPQVDKNELELQAWVRDNS